jgi:hypothetical protein
MLVDERRMPVCVGMGLDEGSGQVMRVLVMLVVHVHERIVDVQVAVTLAKEQHDTSSHEECSEEIPEPERLSQ